MTTIYTPEPWRLGNIEFGKRAVLGPPAPDGSDYAPICRADEPNASLIVAAPDGHKLAEHICAMANDAYLVGHPEWKEIVDEALALKAKVAGVAVK